MNKISFPGLGIGEHEISGTAFKIFGMPVYWYGIIITLGMLSASLYVFWRARRAGMTLDDLLDMTIAVIVSAVVGCRLYYIIMEPGMSLLDFWKFRDGGLAIYGGIIAGAIAALTVCYVKRLRFSVFFDALAPGVMLGQLIGRWGNFINTEVYGRETTLPWRMGLYEGGHQIFVHPLFLYESLWNLVGFIGLNLVYRYRKFNGQIVLLYIAWYGIGRAWMEGLRTDEFALLIPGTQLRVSQCLAIVSAAIAAGVLVWQLIVKWKKDAPKAYMYAHDQPHLWFIPKSGKTSAKSKLKKLILKKDKDEESYTLGIVRRTSKRYNAEIEAESTPAMVGGYVPWYISVKPKKKDKPDDDSSENGDGPEVENAEDSGNSDGYKPE